MMPTYKGMRTALTQTGAQKYAHGVGTSQDNVTCVAIEDDITVLSEQGSTEILPFGRDYYFGDRFVT